MPGLYYDEALDAVPAMQLVLNQPVELVRDAGLSIAGRDVPLMAMDYVGPVYTYLYVPLFAFGGVSAFTVRWLPIALSALTVSLTFAWTQRAFGALTASGATLLLATHPSFLFWARQGVAVTAVLALFGLLALWLAGSWLRRPTLPSAFLFGLIVGLGLTAKVLFLWFIVALAGAGLYVWFSEIRGYKVITQVRPSFLIVALGFLLGAAPVLVYNLMSQGSIAAVVANVETTVYGVHNTSYFANMLTRARSFITLLEGSGFWYLGTIQRQLLFSWALLISLGGIILFLIRRRTPASERRETLALLILVGLFFFQSGVTISGLWPTHLFLLLPLLATIVSLGVVRLFTKSRWLAPVGILLLLAANLLVDLRYHVALAETGGRRAHSDAIVRLADILLEGDGPVYALDWGMKNNLQIITNGRVNPVELFQYRPEPDASFRDWIWGAMHQQGARFLFKTPEASAFHRFEQFQRLAAEWRFTLVLEATALEKDGTPLYYVYTVQRVL
jgi:hypothetical protein